MQIDHSYFLQIALNLAQRAASRGEVPVGAVVVLDNQIIGRGYNQTRQSKNVFSHAEILALKQAQRQQKDFRLEGAKLYVVLEPCLMCLGAALLSQIKEIHYVLPDPTFGSLKSLLGKKDKGSYQGMKFFRHKVLEAEVQALLRSFFTQLRKKDRRRGRVV